MGSEESVMLALIATVSVHLVITADFPLTAADQDYLDMYVRESAYVEALTAIQFAQVPITVNPFLSNPALDFGNLEIHLHSSIFTDRYGRSVAGVYYPPSPEAPVDRIEIAWDRETGTATDPWAPAGHQGNLAHELCHYLLLKNAVYGWDVFLHGMNANPPSSDLYLKRLLEIARPYYPLNYSSDPLKGIQ